MPTEEVQKRTVGKTGEVTLGEALYFVNKVAAHCQAWAQPIPSSAQILDFGCGWGRITRQFLRYTDARNIYGVDPDDEQLEYARKAMPEVNFSTCAALPPTHLCENSFDLIVAYSVFSHLSKFAANQWIEHFSKLLRPGGFAAITTWPRSYIGAKPFTLGDAAEDAGLVRLFYAGGFPICSCAAEYAPRPEILWPSRHSQRICDQRMGRDAETEGVRRNKLAAYHHVAEAMNWKPLKRWMTIGRSYFSPLALRVSHSRFAGYSGFEESAGKQVS